ncbi:MAG TPA: outer membrane beta-barrel protein [Cytophagaceae bacterium]|jgi:hypothetical protein
MNRIIKKIVCTFLLFILVNAGVFSQLRVGVQGGIGMSYVSNVEDHLARQYGWMEGDRGTKTGINLSLLCRYNPLKKYTVFLQAELNYTSKGYRYSITKNIDPKYTSSTAVYPGPGGSSVALNTITYCPSCTDEQKEIAFFQVSMNYVQIPVQVGGVIRTENFDIHLMGGMFFGYWVNGNVKSKNMGKSSYDYRFSEVDQRYDRGIIVTAMVSYPLDFGDIFLAASASAGSLDVRNVEKLTYDKTYFIDPIRMPILA